MDSKRTIEALAAHANQLIGPPIASRVEGPPEEREQAAALVQLAERLKESMPLVKPSPAFAKSLKRELMERARTYDAHARRRRVIWISAAVGSLVSVASIVGAVVYVTRSRSSRVTAG